MRSQIGNLPTYAPNRWRTQAVIVSQAEYQWFMESVVRIAMHVLWEVSHYMYCCLEKGGWCIGICLGFFGNRSIGGQGYLLITLDLSVCSHPLRFTMWCTMNTDKSSARNLDLGPDPDKPIALS